MQLKTRHIVCWSVLYITPLEIKSSSIFKNVAIRSLESFFQLDHLVDISLHLTEATALHHFRALADLKPSWCTLTRISLLTFQTLESISFPLRPSCNSK